MKARVDRVCCLHKKISYFNSGHAISAAIRISQSTGAAYRCYYGSCGFYHLTRSTLEEYRSARESEAG